MGQILVGVHKRVAGAWEVGRGLRGCGGEEDLRCEMQAV